MARLRKGRPCWYELATTDPEGAARFYALVLGWEIADAGMPGFDYRLAKSGGDLVAGIAPAGAPAASAAASLAGAAPGWIFYLTVTDCDKAARAVAKAGGAIRQGPTDIPGTGRFAILADPEGAAFGILAPLADDGRAFARMQAGHGAWHELMAADPAAAMAFYARLFGWKPGDSMDMGPMGSYQLFRHGKADIGGMMRQAPGMPGPGHPFWLPYFGCDGISAAIDRTRQAGGAVLHGPQEVPGGAFIMLGRDPQRALFALVGPK